MGEARARVRSACAAVHPSLEGGTARALALLVRGRVRVRVRVRVRAGARVGVRAREPWHSSESTRSRAGGRRGFRGVSDMTRSSSRGVFTPCSSAAMYLWRGGWC